MGPRAAVAALLLALAGAEDCGIGGSADPAFCTCGEGTFKVYGEERSRCEACPPGRAQGRAETLGDSCFPCYGMTFQPEAGKAACLRCPGGEWGHGTFCDAERPAKAERKLGGFPFVDKRRRLSSCLDAPQVTIINSSASTYLCTCRAGTYRTHVKVGSDKGCRASVSAGTFESAENA